MNQGTDMLSIQSLAFLEKKITVFRKNLKNDNYSYCIKPKQDKIMSSNIVEKIQFGFMNVCLPKDEIKVWQIKMKLVK